jgi:DNA-binding MarR family transcriptional regulator
MSYPRSADPFSTFLSTADRRISLGNVDDPVTHSNRLTVPSAGETAVLSVLAGRGDAHGTSVADLRREIGLSTLQVANLVAALDERGWVQVRNDGDDETVELTDAGRAVARWIDDAAG